MNAPLVLSHLVSRLCCLVAVLAWSLTPAAASAADRLPFIVPGDDATPSATDFSGLSPKPAGADGFVRIQDGHFFAGSSRLKIWGVNLCFAANFPTHDEADKIAAHLAKLGVNGVRLHHHDTAPAPRGVWGKTADGKRALDPEMLERQDYFLNQLHRHGIYANVNLHVGRTFTEAEGFSTQGLPSAVRYSKYLLYFEPRMRDLFKQFCRDYLSHTNAYRGLRRVDDPGIAMLELSNENSFSKLGSDIAASLPEPYRGEFRQQWNRWLARRYASTAGLRQAWGTVPAGQSLEQRDIDIPTRKWSEATRQDARQFMVEIEKGFIREMTTFLKKDLGIRVPITASQITYHGAQIVAETCDYADIHAYWQHPSFPGRPWDPKNWTIRNTPMECAPDADSLLSRAPWRLLDRPFTLSEWNIPDPNDYAASTVPFAAMVAALQDWDGVFFFAYHSAESGWFGDRIRGFFSFNGQPVKLALLSACANLYRRGDLKPLPDVTAGSLNDLLPATLGLSRRIGIDPRVPAPAKLVPPSGQRLSSPDGGVVWDASERSRAHVLVNTPASRAVWGLLAGQRFDLGGVQLTVGPTERNYAAIVFTSLDGKPLETSRRILLAAVGSAQNQGMTWNETRTSVGSQWGAGTAQINPIPAEVALPFHIGSVYALDGRGQHQATVPVRTEQNSSRFTLDPQQRTLWYELTAP